jgi:hypothetical protein
MGVAAEVAALEALLAAVMTTIAMRITVGK